MKRRTPALLVALALGAAACGSTVQPGTGPAAGVATVSDGLGPQGPDADPLAGGDTGPATSAPLDGTTAPDEVGGSGTTDNGTSVSTGGGTRARGTGARGANAFAAGARGVTSREIHIGFEFLANAQQANEALYGAGAVQRGDVERYHQILTDYINATGGILGRKLVPYYHAYDANDQRDRSTVEQAACSAFTQDRKLFAVVSTVMHSDLFRQCLAKSRTAHIASEGLGTSDDGVFAAFPDYVETNTWSSSVLHRIWVQGLAATDYFKPEAATGTTRLGFVTYDDPRARRAVKDHLEPTLRQHGQSLASVVYLAVPQNQSDTGTLVAQINNAVLRFKTEGIDHVMLADVSGTTTLLWMRSAEVQDYRPQYGLTSQNAGQVLADLVDPKQLVGAKSVGWLPFVDVPASEDTTMWEGRRRCREIMAAGGITIDESSRNAERVAAAYCDAYLFLRAALEAAPQPISGSAELRRGATALGDRFAGATTYQHRYGPEKRWGATAYRIVAWHTDCRCFRYATAPITYRR